MMSGPLRMSSIGLIDLGLGAAGFEDRDGVVTAVAVTGTFDAAPCFGAGTRIATPGGEVAVELLTAGQAVSLANGEAAVVRWVGRRRQVGVQVVRITARALGPNVPVRDLIVSNDHGMFLAGVLVQAGLLVNGTTIVSERRAAIVFHHVELERHGVLVADGAEAESYVETGNRRQFSNCAMGYDPVTSACAAEPCAEMVLAGERLAAIRAMIAQRAAPVAGRVERVEPEAVAGSGSGSGSAGSVRGRVRAGPGAVSFWGRLMGR